MKAVVIGPGRIGCGLVGQLLRASGWDVTFIGRGPVVDLLRRHRRYAVRVVEGRSSEDLMVDGVTAVDVGDGCTTAEAIAGADLIATAVGVPNLAGVAPLIATGLARRSEPANVIAFENLLRAGDHLRDHVALHLPGGYSLEEHGFSGAVVSRVVSRRRWPKAPGDPMVLLADRPERFSVQRRALRGELPGIAGMVLTDDYEAHAARKLYTYSAGHAACAYLGFLKGYHYIHSAIRDPEIRAAVRAAMAEGQYGLAARYGRELAGSDDDLDIILDRFANAGLSDPIVRVGRDPRRKLSPEDRLVGAAGLTAASGRAPTKLALAVAAALLFCDPADPSCRAFRREVADRGLAHTLETVCGLRGDETLARLVVEEFAALAGGWSEGNALLSLERRLWAWARRAGEELPGVAA